MKIKSNLVCNVSLINSGHRITVPASPSILELDDSIFKKFVPQLNELVKEEGASWVKQPAKSAEEVAANKAAALLAAKELISKSDK